MRYRTGLVALVMAGVIAVTAPAYASHDPVTTVRQSEPDGLRLVGYHHDQLSPNVDAWAGLQVSGDRYRYWFKFAHRGGRRVFVDLDSVTFTWLGMRTYGPVDPAPDGGAPVYYVGGWHTIASSDDQYRAKALKVFVRVDGVGAIGERCVATYTVAGNGQALGAPAC